MPRSAVDVRHHALVVARAGRDALRQRRVEPFYLVGTDHQSGGCNIFFEETAPLRARNGNNIVALMQQPRQRNLPRRCALLFGHFANDGSCPHVCIEVCALQTRVAPPEIILRILLGAYHHPGQETTAKRTKRHQADAELPQKRYETGLQIALPKGILALQRRNRVDRVRAADRVLPRLGKADEAMMSSIGTAGSTRCW
jgi:hypothetical protein